jgi:hypothetical protein
LNNAQGKTMNPLSKYTASALALVLATQMGVAADFSVGRVPVSIPGDGWRVIEIPDAGSDYNGGVTGTIRSETKVFLKESPIKDVEAILMVRASLAGMNNGWMTYTPECKENRNGYALGNTGTRVGFADCLRVFREFSTQSVLKAIAPKVLEALTAENTILPPSLHTVMSYYANSNGTFVDVRSFMAPKFAGRAGTVAEPLPAGVEAKNVVWGLELAEAVRGSVKSISGKLPLPSLEFAP